MSLQNLPTADPNDKRAPEDVNFNFELSPEDAAWVGAVIKRAIAEASTYGVNIDPSLAFMDLTVVHNHCGGLKLMQLAMSANADFQHDFVGIAVNLDRRAGKLLNGFKPIFMKEQRS